MVGKMVRLQVAGIILLIIAVCDQDEMHEGDWYGQRAFGEFLFTTNVNCMKLHLRHIIGQHYKYTYTLYQNNKFHSVEGIMLRKWPTNTYLTLNPDGTPSDEQFTVVHAYKNVLVIQNLPTKRLKVITLCFTKNKTPTGAQQSVINRFCGKERGVALMHNDCEKHAKSA